MHKRIDLFHEFIPVKITTNGEEYTIGVLNDISKAGISFYSYQEAILSMFGRYVNVSFVYKNIPFNFELEILREAEGSMGYFEAGRFMGIPSVVIKQVRHLLMLAEVKELVLV